MIKPKVIILAGYGLNCEDETKLGFETAGSKADIVHINDLISGGKKLSGYQIMAVPGGFSYGDDTGSGKAYANRLKNHLSEELSKFISRDKLVIGICNGFQILTNLGLLPGALTFNSSARYIDRWVDLKIKNKSPWFKGIKSLPVPIAHGEGRFYINNDGLKQLKKDKAISAKYYKGEMSKYQNLIANPNGSIDDIASVTSNDGKIMGLMPHPERAMFFTQLPNWTLLAEKLKRRGKKLATYGPGLQIFKNGVRYFN